MIFKLMSLISMFTIIGILGWILGYESKDKCTKGVGIISLLLGLALNILSIFEVI